MAQARAPRNSVEMCIAGKRRPRIVRLPQRTGAGCGKGGRGNDLAARRGDRGQRFLMPADQAGIDVAPPRVGRVEIPQEAFLAVLKVGTE